MSSIPNVLLGDASDFSEPFRVPSDQGSRRPSEVRGLEIIFLLNSSSNYVSYVLLKQIKMEATKTPWADKAS